MELDRFRTFYDAHARSVQAYAQSMTGDSSLAADITQESFLRLFTAAGTKGLSETHLRNYLFRIATNLVRDHQRRMRRMAPALKELPAPLQSDECVRDLVHKALSSLKASERELLWLAIVEENSHADIAACTGYRVSSVTTLLYQARKKFHSIVSRLLQSRFNVKRL
jgi:RNA polymerase sigma-70 factor (ECF subfamily)